MKSTTFFRIIVNISCFLGILVIFLMPKNKYEWMLQVDPTLSTLPIDESEGARLIVASLAFAYVLGVQLFIFARTSGRLWRVISMILIAVAAGGWLAKWL